MHHLRTRVFEYDFLLTSSLHVCLYTSHLKFSGACSPLVKIVGILGRESERRRMKEAIEILIKMPHATVAEAKMEKS